MISWEVKKYNELSLDEFHDLIALRIEIFVVEQTCPYQELDGKDKIAFHLIGKNEQGEIMATSRILGAGISYDDVSIGRVVVSKKVRGKGIAHEMMEETKKFVQNQFGNVPIRISAQVYLEKYYSKHGFEFTGKKYLEDEIPHMEMLYHPKN